MTKVILSLAIVGFFLNSCGNSTNKKSNNQTEVTEQNHQHLDDDNETIELNNGEKWEVDVDMLAHIRNMENDVVSFAEIEQKDYKSLAEKLQTNLDLLTSNCTMKGKAHDELHKWLLPYIDLVKSLYEAEDEAEAAKQFENIKISFSTFNQFFQ